MKYKTYSFTVKFCPLEAGNVICELYDHNVIQVWNSSYPCTLKYQHDMKEFSWKYTQFTQFNSSDTLLLVSGVHFGSNLSTSGEIAVFTLQSLYELVKIETLLT